MNQRSELVRPKVSICITSHNYSRWVSDAVESALTQSYEPIEVIVADDGSTDGSLEVLRVYGDRIRVLALAHHGQRAAGSAAFEESSGEIVIFLDADDMLDRDIVRQVVDAFDREPRPVFVQFRLRTIDEDGFDIGRDRPARRGVLPSGDLRAVVLQRRNWYYQLTSGCAYSASVLRELLPAPLLQDDVGSLDHHLNESIALFGPIRSIDEIGGSYRAHGSGVSAVASDDAVHPRRMIHITRASFADVARAAAKLHLDYPDDPDTLLDPAYLGWCLWSLRIDPGAHPIATDRRRALVRRGVRASLTHPLFPWRHRAKRAIWFVLVGVAPRRLVPSVLRWYRPDGPRIIGGQVVA